MSVLVAFSATPLGVGERVGEIVAEAVRVVRESGLPNQTDAMFTLVEGESWDEVMDVVKRAVEAVAARAPRVSTVIKVDYRPGATGALTAKVESVERYLAKGHGRRPADPTTGPLGARPSAGTDLPGWAGSHESGIGRLLHR